MNKFSNFVLLIAACLVSTCVMAQSDSIVLKDIEWDKKSPARSTELFIPSGNALMAGVIYQANGSEKHPTLILLHGYPGNEHNLDIAQVVRAHGWNVIYFDYRGSWGSQGIFSFKNCVTDVSSVVAYCNKFQDSLKIDTSNLVLFGHSMGAWICLKALENLPQIKKGFALSTWDVYGDVNRAPNEEALLKFAAIPQAGGRYFVLNATLKEIFDPVIKEPDYFNLANGAMKLAGKQIMMLDEHPGNKQLAATIGQSNKTFFEYGVWQTDHPFSNKRVALIKKLVTFIDR